MRWRKAARVGCTRTLTADRAGFGAKKPDAPVAAPEADQRCPCGGAAPYARCCKPFHAGAALPPTPAALLRSRFTAYAKGLGDYVVATTHPDNEVLRHGSKTADGVVVSTLAADVAASAEKLRFSDLEVLAESAGAAPNQAIVAFRYKVRRLRARCTPTQCVTQRLRLNTRRCKWWGRRVSAGAPARASRRVARLDLRASTRSSWRSVLSRGCVLLHAGDGEQRVHARRR